MKDDWGEKKHREVEEGQPNRPENWGVNGKNPQKSRTCPYGVRVPVGSTKETRVTASRELIR